MDLARPSFIGSAFEHVMLTFRTSKQQCRKELIQFLSFTGFRRGEFGSLSLSTMTVFFIVVFPVFLCIVLTSFRPWFIVSNKKKEVVG